MVLACDNNWDFAWDLLPEEDYLTGRVEDYDEVTHQVINTKNMDGRPVRESFILFVCTQRSPQFRNGSKKKMVQANQLNTGAKAPVLAKEPLPDPKRKRVKATKQDVKRYTELGDIDALVSLCFDDKKPCV